MCGACQINCAGVKGSWPIAILHLFHEAFHKCTIGARYKFTHHVGDEKQPCNRVASQEHSKSNAELIDGVGCSLDVLGDHGVQGCLPQERRQSSLPRSWEKTGESFSDEMSKNTAEISLKPPECQ